MTALALGVAACGGGDDNSSSGGGGGGGGRTTLTIYSSLPLQGDSRPQSSSVVNGEKLALEKAGGKVGDYTIKYVSLDDATAAAGKWDPGATSGNARKAAQDKSTIAYLGEFNSGAAAISIPILNDAGVPMISPANTAVGLTTDEPGATPGEPDKYYPTGEPTYFRLAPRDSVQAAALTSAMVQAGCTRVATLTDNEVYGVGLGAVARQRSVL